MIICMTLGLHIAQGSSENLWANNVITLTYKDEKVTVPKESSELLLYLQRAEVQPEIKVKLLKFLNISLTQYELIWSICEHEFDETMNQWFRVRPADADRPVLRNHIQKKLSESGLQHLTEMRRFFEEVPLRKEANHTSHEIDQDEDQEIEKDFQALLKNDPEYLALILSARSLSHKIRPRGLKYTRYRNTSTFSGLKWMQTWSQKRNKNQTRRSSAPELTDKASKKAEQAEPAHLTSKRNHNSAPNLGLKI